MSGLRLTDWFCGAGGATQGAHKVPGVVPVMAANHDKLAIATHSANFPDVEHFRGDIKDCDVARHPYAELFWASPECTNWSQAKGKAVDFDTQPGLFGDPEITEDVARSRALMQDVIRYLEGMALRRRPVLAGVVENVTDIRKWDHWMVWRSRIERIGYTTRLIALNSMHAVPVSTPWAPQSRDRLYLAYWHKSLGRHPDWDKWLRPAAWCPTCQVDVAAVQAWKRPGVDMGRYGRSGQYVYRCPSTTCRNQIVEPYFVPAAAAIDWTLPGERIGDRKKPLAPKTLARIEAGLAKYARPITLEVAGHTFERRPGVRTRPVDTVLTAQTTTSTKAVALPLLVPVEGRDGKHAASAGEQLRTQTARNETSLVVTPFLTAHRDFTGGHSRRLRAVSDPLATLAASGNHHGLVVPAFIAELRGGGSKHRPVDKALGTFSAGGQHHGLVTTENTETTTAARTMSSWAAVYAYDTGRLRDHQRESLPTQRVIGGDGVLSGAGLPSVEQCLFRMLEPHEIHAGMAFTPSYVVLGSKRDKVRQLGNAVTPPVAEILISALVETITGQQLERTA